MVNPERPFFSVLVPAYNAEKTLAQTLEALEGQAFQDWECIVVDDGSVDSTESIATTFARRDPRFEVISQKNRGTAGAYNTALRHARADWVVICAADDWLLSDHLEIMHDAIAQTGGEFDIYSSNGRYFYDSGTTEVAFRVSSTEGPEEHTLGELLIKCFYPVGAVMRRETCIGLGGLNEEAYSEDYDMFLRILASGGRHLCVPQVLSVHRRNAVQKSSDHLRMRRDDLATIERLLSTYSLSDEDCAIAQRTIKRLKRNIAVRQVTSRVFGERAGSSILGFAHAVKRKFSQRA